MPFSSLNFASLAFLGSGRAGFLVYFAVFLIIVMASSYVLTRALRMFSRL